MFLHATAVVADIVVTSHHRLRSVGKSGETLVKRRQNFCATTPTDAICCDYECLLAHFPRQRQCWVVAISCRWLLKSQVAREKTLKFSPLPLRGWGCAFPVSWDWSHLYVMISARKVGIVAALINLGMEMETNFARETNPMNNDSFE